MKEHRGQVRQVRVPPGYQLSCLGCTGGPGGTKLAPSPWRLVTAWSRRLARGPAVASRILRSPVLLEFCASQMSPCRPPAPAAFPSPERASISHQNHAHARVARQSYKLYSRGRYRYPQYATTQPGGPCTSLTRAPRTWVGLSLAQH